MRIVDEVPSGGGDVGVTGGNLEQVTDGKDWGRSVIASIVSAVVTVVFGIVIIIVVTIVAAVVVRGRRRG